MDGNFIFTALKYKLDIRHRIESLLQENNIKLFILKSLLDELRSVGEKTSATLAWAQECCEIIDDSCMKENSTPLDRLKEILGMIVSFSCAYYDDFDLTVADKRRYFIATQDRDLRLALNRIPGVPLMYFNKVTLVLEGPSKASLNFNKNVSIFSKQHKKLLSSINFSNRLKKRKCPYENLSKSLLRK